MAETISEKIGSPFKRDTEEEPTLKRKFAEWWQGKKEEKTQAAPSPSPTPYQKGE